MPPRSNVPVRICGSKSRVGCRTCKQRHLKCDENHPVCHRCQKAGRPCIYDTPQGQNTRRAYSPAQTSGLTRSTQSRNRSGIELSRLTRTIGPYEPRKVAEVGAIEYFAVHFGKDLAGSFSDHVWCYICPKVAQYEAPIWHAIVAISMLDSNIRLGQENYGDDLSVNRAIQQYNKALGDLNMRLGLGADSSHQDVVLLSCILFAIFECLQGHVQSALRHIRGGMRLLTQWGYSASIYDHDGYDGYLNRRSLMPIFLSLDSQAIQMGVVEFRDDFSMPAMVGKSRSLMHFETVEDAHLELNCIFNRLSHWAYWNESNIECLNKPDDEWMTAERQQIMFQFAEWDFAFEVHLNSAFPPPPIILLMVQRKVLEAFLGKETDGSSPLEWDKYTPLFRDAVEYAEMYMKETAGSWQPHDPSSVFSVELIDKPRPVFTVAMDIVMSLFLISVKCRDLLIRRRALEMLKFCNRKEGIWDSNLSAGIAETVIELEQSSVSVEGFVPENGRIYEIDVRLGEERAGRITHKKYIAAEEGCGDIENFEEEIVW